MLKFRNFLYFLQNILLVALILLGMLTFYIRYRMQNITRNMSYLDKKIEDMYDNKKILLVELTYLTSTERLLSLIDKNPEILNAKKITDIKQVKTRGELVELCLAKAIKEPYNNRKIARTINNLIENEI